MGTIARYTIWALILGLSSCFGGSDQQEEPLETLEETNQEDAAEVNLNEALEGDDTIVAEGNDNAIENFIPEEQPPVEDPLAAQIENLDESSGNFGEDLSGGLDPALASDPTAEADMGTLENQVLEDTAPADLGGDVAPPAITDAPPAPTPGFTDGAAGRVLYVMQSNTSAHNQPDFNATTINKLAKGKPVVVITMNGQWAQTSFGWIQMDSLSDQTVSRAQKVARWSY